MRFSIITPTYKRASKLARAVRSLQAQTYPDWELIIVNDSPSDISYREFASSINDARIRYYQNISNCGVNFSRNYALERLSADSSWVILLDDDDYFAPDALATFVELIRTHQNTKWFVTNRALQDGTPITRAKKSDTQYSYIFDYLFFKRFRGDATHCIDTNLLHKLRFSSKIKQGEEWLFFYELGLTTKMFYHDHNSTITEGYNTTGLNYRKRGLGKYLEDISILMYEGVQRGLWYHPTFTLYMCGRVLKFAIKAILKKN